jgi:hypothetical protein
MDFDLLIMAFLLITSEQAVCRLRSLFQEVCSLPIIVNWRTIEGTINEKEVIGGMVVLELKSICAYIRVYAPVRE